MRVQLIFQGRKFSLLKAYFCGQHAYCMQYDSKKAATEAKMNIEKYYKLVGLTERLDDTWKLMEKEYPDAYFKGFYEFAIENKSIYHFLCKVRCKLFYDPFPSRGPKSTQGNCQFFGNGLRAP